MKRLVLCVVGFLMISAGAVAQSREIGRIDYSCGITGYVTGCDHIVVQAVTDPKIDGVTCYWTIARKGGITGAVGLATDPNEASLACRQTGPIRIKEKFAKKGENIAKTSQNWNSFNTMQVVRMCDPVGNSLIYTVYSDELLNGFPRNSVSAIAIQLWGPMDSGPPRCADFVK